LREAHGIVVLTWFWGRGACVDRGLGRVIWFAGRERVNWRFDWGRPVSTWVAKLQVRTEVQVTS